MKKIIKMLVLSAMPMLFSTATYAEQDKHSAATIERQLLLKKKLTLPSNNILANVIRVQFPKGYKTLSHTHEGPGPRYVVRGQLRVEDNGETKTFNAGEVFWETGDVMTVENVGLGEAEIIIFEMAPAK
jgi:quercetin dioxygenase-like cupin family protein